MPNKRTAQDAYRNKRVLYTSVPLFVLLLPFGVWAFGAAPRNPLAILAATLLTFLYALVGIQFIPQWMAAWSRRPWLPARRIEGKRSARRSRLHPFWTILIGAAAFRVLLFVVAYVLLLRAEEGTTGGIFDNLDLWNRLGTDSRHYLNIAENWYVNAGDDRLLIVFFPLYPILVRVFRFVFNNYLMSGLFVSNVCAVFACWAFYELALLDADRRTALRQLKYLCILPAAFLFSAPLSDSLFLLLSILCVYLVRTDRYPLAGMVGFFAALTRMPGVLLLAPACFELVGRSIREYADRKKDRRWILGVVKRGLSLLLIPLGLLLYLYINYRVTGNAFMFLTYQSEHWSQNLGWFFASAATQVVNATGQFAGNKQMLFGLWLPNLVYLFASLGIVAGAQEKMRASNVAYFLLYYAVCMGATWLLSAPRYLTAAFPLALALGCLTENKWVDRAATATCLILMLYYMFAYVNQWYVY